MQLNSVLNVVIYQNKIEGNNLNNQTHAQLKAYHNYYVVNIYSNISIYLNSHTYEIYNKSNHIQLLNGHPMYVTHCVNLRS